MSRLHGARVQPGAAVHKQGKKDKKGKKAGGGAGGGARRLKV